LKENLKIRIGGLIDDFKGTRLQLENFLVDRLGTAKYDIKDLLNWWFSPDQCELRWSMKREASVKNIDDLIKKIEDNSAIKNLEDNEKRLQKLEKTVQNLKEDPAILKEEEELFAKLSSKLDQQSSKLGKLEKAAGITFTPSSASEESQLAERQDKQWTEINKVRELINKLSKSEGLPPIEAPKRVAASLSSPSADQLELVNRQDKQWTEINKVRELINKLSKGEGLSPIEEPKRIPATCLSSSSSSQGQAELVKKQDEQWKDINKLREFINKLSKHYGLAPIKAPKRISVNLECQDDSAEMQSLNKKYDSIFNGISKLTAALDHLDGPSVGDKYDSIFTQLPDLEKRIAILEKNDEESKKVVPKEKKQKKQKQKKNGSPKQDEKELKALEKKMSNFEKRLDQLEKVFC